MVDTCRFLLAFAALLVTGVAHADDIRKCVDAAGNVNYTDAACPDGQRLERSFEAINPRPSGTAESVPMAPVPEPAPVQTAPAVPSPSVVAPEPMQQPAPEPEVIYVPSGGVGYGFPDRRYRPPHTSRPPYGGGAESRPPPRPRPDDGQPPPATGQPSGNFRQLLGSEPSRPGPRQRHPGADRDDR